MSSGQRIIITRCIIIYILCFLLLRFIEYTTPSRLLSPPLFNLQLDITYWVYALLGIPEIIVHNPIGAVIFDFLLFLTGIFAIIFPLNRYFVISFTLLTIIYVLTFNAFATHHSHSMAGMMVILLPFWVADNEKCFLLWQGIRYYTCYIYSISFIWKTFIGSSFFNWEQGVGTFKSNLVDYLYHNPETLLSGFYRWCIREEWFLNIGNIFIVLLEGFMMIGFFTKKYDKILFWFPIIIHVTTYFFSDVLFFELLVLDFSLLNMNQFERMNARLKWNL
ncbi:MAG TPA: hypothetical protein VMI12_00770 [Puia sp.]|nr:hypothetical protein [Puia sp.]